MNETELKSAAAKPQEPCSVLVVFEDTPTRERALALCDHLAAQSWAEVEFAFHWLQTNSLDDPRHAATAAGAANTADFIVFCVAPERELSPAVQQWFEIWIEQRAGHEGTFVDLTGSAGRLSTRLRDLAHRAQMDYLTEAPAAFARMLPDSFESAALRASQTTSVLDDILRHCPPPQIHLRLPS